MRLIDSTRLILQSDGKSVSVQDIVNSPTVDAVPVVHGKWINPHFRNSYYCCNCSACSGEAMHMEFRWHKKGIYRICPNCGADMREVNMLVTPPT